MQLLFSKVLLVWLWFIYSSKIMKKVIILIVAMVLCRADIFAQAKFGVTGGINVSSLMGPVETRPNAISIPGPIGFTAGAMVGGFARYDFKEIRWLGVQADMLFSMQGGRNLSYWREGQSHTINTLRQNYINLPLLVDFKPFGRVPLSFLVGVQGGLCVWRSADGKRIKNTAGSIYFNRDVASILGLRYVFTEQLSAEFRYIYSNSPTLSIDDTWMVIGNPNPDGSVPYKTAGGENVVFQFRVSWTFLARTSLSPNFSNRTTSVAE
jgi:hypothetical protein